MNLKRYYFFALVCALALRLVAQHTQADVKLFRIVTHGKEGYIDRTGKVIVEPLYDGLPHHAFGAVFWARLNGKCRLTDIRGTIRGQEEFDDVKEAEITDLWVFRKKEKWGALDSTGKVVIPFKFESIGYFSGGFAPARLDGRDGFIDKQGNFTPFEQGLVFQSLGEGFFSVKKGQELGLYSAHEKKIVLKPQFHEISRMRYRQVIVVKNGFVSIYDVNRKDYIVKPDAYDDIIMSFKDPSRNQLYGEDLLSAEAEDSLFLALRPLRGKGTPKVYCIVNSAGKECGLLDTACYNFEPNFFSGISVFSCKKTGLKKGVIDAKGQVLAEPAYDYARYCSDGLLPVSKNGKWGYLDKTGKSALPCEYKGFGFFINGLAWVSKVIDNKLRTGYIDKSGAWAWYREEAVR